VSRVLLRVDGLGLEVPDRAAARGFGAPPTRMILRDVGFTLERGGTLGVIGESGSGKSSLARALTLLMPPQRGRIVFDGKDVMALSPLGLTSYRARLQLVFQDPMSALNPRRRVGASIVRPVGALGQLAGRKPAALAAQLLERVGLAPALAERYPHELSGGQRQRVNIARALALEPAALIADEVTSGLDVSVQARIVALLEALRRDSGMALIFISHDLSLVRSLCDDLLILRAGEVIEAGPADQVFTAPQQDYTRRLLAAIPLPDPDPRWLERS
jgi:dipeptide transport system ATP-binding protein